MQKIRKFEVLIEEHVSGAVRPVEVLVDAPVATLILALVDELHLPRTDSAGNHLIYLLRTAPDGRMLAGDKSLQAAGIANGTHLILDSYALSGSAAHLFKDGHVQHAEHGGHDGHGASFYTDNTLPDGLAFPALDRNTSAALPAVKKERKATRRAFLMLSGAALSVGSVSLGYTLYRLLLANPLTLPAKRATVHLATQPTQAPTQPTLPTMAKAQLVFSQHQQPVHAVSWSPDGTILASGSLDAQLLLWDTKGNVHARSQQGGAIRALAWSPVKRTQMLAVGAGNLVNFVNSLSGTVLARGNVHTKAVTGLAWSAQQPQMLASGSLDQKDIVWNTTTFRPQTVFALHTATVEAVSWATDGQTIASSSHGGVVRVWNALSAQEVHGYYFDGPVPLRALAFAPTGTMLAVGGDDGVVRLWNNGTVCQQQGADAFGTRCMDTPQRWQAHTKTIRTLAWSPDGRFLATGGDDGKLAIWYPAQSHLPLLTVNHNAPVLSLSWSPDGKMAAAASANNVTLWRLQ